MELSFLVFPNKTKKSDKAPDMRGDVEIDGAKHQVAAWTKLDKNGNKYLAFKISPDTYVKPEAEAPPTANYDEGLPF
jgi:uncharacterized protein (DUF736 family)